MGFTSYRATRQINLGQLRHTLQPGDVVEFDGRTTRIGGKDHTVPTTDGIIQAGWLVPLTPVATEPAPLAVAVPGAAMPQPVEKAPRKPQEASYATPPREDQGLDKGGNKINYASPEARAASGKRPNPDQKHVWNTAGPAPDWLNNLDGGRTCKVCGVKERTDLIRADRMRGDGTQQFHYTDAHGNNIVAFEELSCPTYLGDPGSAAAYAKDQVRKVRGRVDDAEDKLDDHDSKFETVDERLARLEADNDFLRRRILETPVLDAQMIAEALLILANRARPDGSHLLGEKVRALLPAPALDINALRPVLDELVLEVVPEEDLTRR